MRKFLTVMLLLVFAAWSSYGQVASSYAFASTSGTYTPITGGTVWQTGAWDDVTATVALGFNFTANGTTFTNLTANTNGYMTSYAGSLGYNPISSSTVTPIVIAAFGRDLQGNATSEIRYETSGSAPNRVFTMQWTDAKRYGGSYVAENLNFQIKLYETSNKIEFVYGVNAGTTYATPTHPQVGLRGSGATDFFNRTTTTDWSASTQGTLNSDRMTINSTVVPANGLTYTFTLIPPGNVAINSPGDGTTGILTTATLNWTAGTGGAPAGYMVYFGTDNPPTNVANGVVVATNTYDPTPDMLNNTLYYWQIVPFNGGGQPATAPVWSFTTVAGFGSLEGFVLNCYGVPVEGATVAAQGPSTYTTTSAANGFFQFVGIPASVYTLGAQLAGYNTTTIPGVVVGVGTTTTQNITLPQPGMTVLPNPNNVSLSPNEMFNGAFTVTNPGCGQLGWTASIGSWSSSNHSWLTMPTLAGTVAPSTNVNVPAMFDATGLPVGTLLSAVVTFTSTPDIGSYEVPVNMVVAGEALVPVTNLEGTLTNQYTGDVTLTWECTPSAGFLFYTVKRDGVQIALVPAATTYNDVLPTYGTYNYCVDATYVDGSTAPACVTIEWPNPTMTWTPNALAETVWTNTSEILDLEIGNTGLGTLAFEFPDYVDNSGDSPLAYCAAQATVCDEYIGNVTFGTINNSTGCSFYANYTALSTDLVKGESVAMTAQNGGNAYASDNVYVWIDYNHNDVFDATELTTLATLGGGTNFSGSIAVPSDALSGVTTMRVRMSYATSANPCGSQSYGEVEDYSVVIKAPTFITAVTPASGFVASEEMAKINVTFSATDDYAAPGVYVNQLKLNSNDLANAAVNIQCTMTVTVPGTISGVATDCVSNDVLPGVMVQAGDFTAMTDDNGAYSFMADAGTYELTFTKIGYQTVTVSDVVVVAGAVTTVNASMCEEPYAPSCASASVNADDTQSTVTWCVPAGPYELLYDDGTAENFAAWQLPGNMNAVKFTPKGYPAKVVGAKLFVGDGSFPAGGVIDGAEFSVAVYSAGSNGMPDQMLDSVPASVTNLGWVNVTGLNATVASGDFFIVMIQGTISPNCAPIGVDETQPKAYKSYSRNVGTGSPWVVSPFQDFMMHAVVSGPMSGDDDAMAVTTVIPGKVAGMISQSIPMANGGQTGLNATVTAPEGYDNMDLVSHYSLSRYFVGAVSPVPPSTVTGTLLNNNITATTYTEGGTTWSALAQGWYAYGVKAVYPNDQESAEVYTNNVPHKMFADVIINVKLVCGFVPAEGAFLTLTGNDYPYDVLTATVPASGTVTFDNVIKGKYTLTIVRGGYYTYSVEVTINADKTIDAVLEDLRYMPRNLVVDCGTLVATWDEPLAIAVQEDFEGGVFPPAGWQATTQGTTGWYATTDGGSAGFAVPSHTTYAIANDDQEGSSNNGCCDYLITPEMDLTGAPSYVLSFQSYYTAAYGHLAYVEMSTDAGASWTPVYTVTAAGSWQQVDVDLSAYSGAAGLASVWFAFHSDDAGVWASGWAIDDVVLASGGVPVQGYGVFLDATEVGQTQELTWTFDPNTINYGQTYVAGVAGLYCSGYSDLETYTFTSCFLYPPRNLEAVANTSTTSGAAILTWEAPLGGDYAATGSIARTSFPSANAEYSPMVTQHTGGDNSDAMWDILLQFQCQQVGNAGIETDGTYIYVTIWSGGGFRSFDLSGNFVEEFNISGVNSIRDLAYNTDNGHMYGGANGNTLYEMDFTNKVLVGSVSSAGAPIRHISYNPNLDGGNGGFYVGDWTTMRSIKMDGSTIADAPLSGLTGVYGSAYDPANDVIWAFDQGGAGLDLVEFDAETMVATGNMHDAAADLGIDAIAGGLAFSDLLVSGRYVMLGLGQDNGAVADFVFEYDMGEDAGGGGGAGNLVAYRIYRDDAVLVDVPTTPLEYWDLNLMPGTYCYDITAVYDLTPYGFPGTTGESVKEGTACVDIMYGFDLPFMEDFTTGQFDVNLWTVGQNWIMDGQAGNLLPSAKFKWDPLLTDYSESLESFYMNAAAINSTTPYKIWLDYDLKLDDRTASTKEMLTVEVWNGSTWNDVKEYTNSGDFDWTAEHINISTGAKNNVFKVRFRANGDLTGDIFSWSVDNIHIYVGYEFNPPLNLVANSEGTPENDIKLTWGAPAGGGTVMTYILDDGSAENGWAINPGYESWLGNEFAVAENGVLQSLDLYWMANAGAGSEMVTVDIFDASHTVVGSTAPFAPVSDAWQTVALADVPFSGTFYAMVRWNNLAGNTNYLGSDEDGPNAAANYGWYYDGSAWAHLSDLGYAPCVFTVRAKALVDGDKSVVTYGPSSQNTGSVATLTAVSANKSANTGNHSVSSAVSLGDNSEGLTGYNVYRRAYAVFPAGQNTAAAGDWTMIATVVPTEYLDMNLSNLVTNCYEYQVTAIYDEGESDPSNIDWECIFVGIDPNEGNDVSIYPNPATISVRINLTKTVSNIVIYNSLGSVVAEKNIKGESYVMINTSNYAAGAYSVKFSNSNGETFSRKFVVTK